MSWLRREGVELKNALSFLVCEVRVQRAGLCDLVGSLFNFNACKVNDFGFVFFDQFFSEKIRYGHLLMVIWCDHDIGDFRCGDGPLGMVFGEM